MRNLTNEQGRSLVEMLAVVSIIGVLTVGAISAATYGLKSMNLASLYETVESTASGVSDLYSWSRAYPNSDDGSAENMGTKIAENDICDGCTADGNNAVTDETPLLKMTISPDTAENFQIILTPHGEADTIPVDICNRLADFTWQNVEWDENNTCSEGTTQITFTAY